MSSKAKLRIFVDGHVFDGAFQGTTTYLKGLYGELIKDKNLVFFIAASDTDHLQTIFGTHDNVVYLRYAAHNKFVRLLFDIPRLLLRHKIDYAHFQYVVPPLKLCKYIITVHDVLFLDFPQYFPGDYKRKNKFLFGTSTAHSDVVLTVSDYSKKRIAQHFKASRITVTPNGVDASYFESYDQDAARTAVKSAFGIENYWLFVSRWEPRKNHHTLLRAFVEYGHYQQHQLVFVGGKALDNEAYNTYYADLPEAIKARVIVLDAVRQDNLLLILRGATLSVYPSIAEGFGIPPLESLAAGIPTICSRATAMADFDFMQKHLFDPLDPQDISQKATVALGDGKTSDMRESVREKYNWAVAAAAFLGALSD